VSQTTQEKVDKWDMTTPLLKAMFQQFIELSKKKPEAALNKPKVAMVNRLLEKCREVLADEMSLQFLDLSDGEQLPQNSDVVFILSQYDSAMKQFREDHGRSNGYSRVWHVDGEANDPSDDEEEEDGEED
jgi:hypothetical protein